MNDLHSFHSISSPKLDCILRMLKARIAFFFILAATNALLAPFEPAHIGRIAELLAGKLLLHWLQSLDTAHAARLVAGWSQMPWAMFHT
jgi:hypothetical protein